MGATFVEASCFVKGREGGARFDDMELREVAEDPAIVVSGTRFEVRVGPQGLFSIRREGGAQDIVRDGQVVEVAGGSRP